MNEKYAKLGSNMGWMLIGNFASKVLIFFLIPLYTAYMTTSEYGIVDLISTTVSLITPFLSMLVTDGVLRFVLEDKYDKKQVFSITIYIILIGFGVLLLMTPIIVLSNSIRPYIVLFLLYYLLSVLVNALQQFLKGLNHIKNYVLSGVFNTSINVVLNILLLVVYNKGIYGYLLAIVGGFFFTLIYIVISEKIWMYIVLPNRIDKKLLKNIMLFCLPLIPNSVSWWVSNSSDKYMLSFFCGTTVLGVYSIAYKIPSLMNTLSSIFTSAWQISAVEDFGSQESIIFYTDIYKKYNSLYSLIVSAVILFIKIIAGIMFSNEFYFAWPYAIVLIYGAMFQALSNFLGTIYTSSMKTKKVFVTTSIGAISNIILNFALIPKFGGMGAAIATFISYMIVWVVRVIDSRKIIKLNLELRKDIIIYLAITLQGIIMCMEIKGYYIYNIILFLFIVFMNKDFMNYFFMFIKKRVLRK